MAASPVRDAAAAAIADRRLTDLLAKFDAAVSDDLNTAVALTLVEEAAAMKTIDAGQKRAVLETMDAVLGLQLLTLSREALRIRPRSRATPGSPRSRSAGGSRDGRRSAARRDGAECVGTCKSSRSP